MNSPTFYIEISQGSLQLLNGTDRFEFPLERLESGRLTDSSRQKLTAALQDFLKRKNRVPALCAIGARGVSFRRLTIPASTKEELRRLLRLQIESEFPLPPEQLAWGYRTLRPSGSRQQEILVVAVKREWVEDYSEIFSTCGLSANFTIAALARSELCPQRPQSFAVLDIGGSQSEMISFENGAPVSIRVLAWGGEKLKLLPESDLAASLESLAGCINPKWIGQKLFITGIGARQNDFAPRLEKFLGNGVKCEDVKIPDESLSAAIAGLKKSHEESGAEPLIVLQLNETKNGERTAARSAPWKWVALSAAFAMLLILLPFLEALALKSRTAKKLSAIKTESGRLAVIDRELSFLQDLRKNQSPYLDTVYLVANSTPPGTRFDTFAMNRRGEISLKGNMGNAQQVTEFRTKLIGSGFFSTVVVDEQTPTPDRQKVAVRITAQWKPAASRKLVALEPAPAKTDKPKSGGNQIKAESTSGDSNSRPAITPAPRKESKE
ncbi:MAG: hypothetical protein ABIQ35_11370 [Verrucomicrobiota bacterium]